MLIVTRVFCLCDLTHTCSSVMVLCFPSSVLPGILFGFNISSWEMSFLCRHIWDLDNEDSCYNTMLIPKSVIMCTFFSKANSNPTWNRFPESNATTFPAPSPFIKNYSPLCAFITHYLFLSSSSWLCPLPLICYYRSNYFSHHPGTSEGRDAVFVCSPFHCTYQNVEFAPLFRLSAMLN